MHSYVYILLKKSCWRLDYNYFSFCNLNILITILSEESKVKM